MYKIRIVMIALLSAGWAAGSMAAEHPLLTLSAALQRATGTHPALQAARLKTAIAGGQRDANAQSPATTVGLEVENFAGNDSASGLDGAETTFSIARKFERGDKAKLRQAAGEQRVYLAELGELVTQLEVEAGTEQLFYHVLASQSNEQNATEAVGLAKQLLGIVERRVEIGRSSMAESHTAFIRLTRARLELDQALQSSVAARNRLALSWGADAADFDAVAGDLMRIPAIPNLSGFRKRLEANPELVRLANEKELAHIQRQLATAQARTDVQVSAGIRYLAEPNDAAFVVAVSMPFGQRKRARPLVNAARARAAQIPLETEWRRRELVGTVAQLHAEIEQRQLALRAIRDDMVPRADESLELYRKGYELGGYSLLELIEAQNLALGLRRELVAVAAKLHALRIELTRLTGGSQAPGAST